MAVATKELLRREDRRLTHSEIQTARTCLRKHQLAYGLGLRKVEPAAALHFGSAVHEALDVRARIIRSGSPEEFSSIRLLTINAALAIFDRHAPKQGDDNYSHYLLQRQILCNMISAYDWKWEQYDNQIEILATEMSFDIPIINPQTGRSSRTFSLTGKIDKIIRLQDGRIAIMEHKTAGVDVSPESDYWKRLRIDSQISVYYLAAKELGYDVQTVVYDVLRKPEIGPATITQGETKELLENGIYARIPQNGERVDYGQITGTRTEGEGDFMRVWIDGEEVQVIPGKKGFAIRESLGMYSMRLAYDYSQRPEYYFQRREIPRIEADLEEARFELWEEAKRLSFHEQRGIFPRNTSACIGFGKCPYFDLCTAGYDVASGVIPEGFRITDRVHAELED